MNLFATSSQKPTNSHAVLKAALIPVATSAYSRISPSSAASPLRHQGPSPALSLNAWGATTSRTEAWMMMNSSTITPTSTPAALPPITWGAAQPRTNQPAIARSGSAAPAWPQVTPGRERVVRNQSCGPAKTSTTPTIAHIRRRGWTTDAAPSSWCSDQAMSTMPPSIAENPATKPSAVSAQPAPVSLFSASPFGGIVRPEQRHAAA